MSNRNPKFLLKLPIATVIVLVASTLGCGRSKIDVRHRADVISTSDLTVSMDALRLQITYSVSGGWMLEGGACTTCSIQTEVQTMDGVRLHNTENPYLPDSTVSLTLFAKDDSIRALLKGEIAIVSNVIKLGCASPIASARLVADLGKPNTSRPSPIGVAPPDGSQSYKIATRVAELRSEFHRTSPQPQCVVPQ